LKGHKESGCFKKFPEKALAWFKEKSVKTKSASLNVEVSLMSLDPAKLGIHATLLQAKCHDTLAILSQENEWICDTGARTHVTRSNRGAKNVQDTKMYSLGHAGTAMESTASSTSLGSL
jgi:hypothetical protein